MIITVYQTGISSHYESTSRTSRGSSLHLRFIAFAFHLRQFEFLNMASQLNGYRNFIDIRNKESQSLVYNAVDKFISPLVGDERIQLLGKDFQKLKDNHLRLGSCYGYDHLIKRYATVRTVILEIVDDPNAVPPVVGVPEEIHYTNSIIILEHCLDEHIVLARKHASLTWGDRSFTIMASSTIEPLTVANGGLVRARTLSDEGKELILERMHSKFLGHQIMELLTPSARQAIEQHANLFTLAGNVAVLDVVRSWF